MLRSGWASNWVQLFLKQRGVFQDRLLLPRAYLGNKIGYKKVFYLKQFLKAIKH